MRKKREERGNEYEEKELGNGTEKRKGKRIQGHLLPLRKGANGVARICCEEGPKLLS